MTESTRQSRYRVDGMDCASCAAKIDTAVRRVPGVSDVAVSATAGTMTVHHDGKSDLAAIERQVTGLGYAIAPLTTAPGPRASKPDCDHDHDDHDHGGHDHGADRHVGGSAEELAALHGHDHGPTNGPWWRGKKGQLTIACGVALAVAYGVGKLVPAIEAYAFTAAMLVGLVPIARRALMAARAGTPFSIEMLMTIAAVGAVVIHASEEAAAVVFLFLIGELLEGVAAGKARASIQSLAKLVPKTALVEDLHFFSGLMGWWELQIVARFAQLPQYVPVFMSCNQPNGDQWCGRCPKCVMTFTFLSAFLEPDMVWSVFNANLFDDASLYPVFEELMGLRGVKPLECVSTPEEMLAALYLAQARPNVPLSPFFQRYAEPIARGAAYLHLLDDFNPEHLFPAWYTPFVPFK